MQHFLKEQITCHDFLSLSLPTGIGNPEGQGIYPLLPPQGLRIGKESKENYETSGFPCPAFQPQDTLHSLAAGTEVAGQRCELVALITASFSIQSLADVCKPPQEPSGTFKREAAAFSFKELQFCLQLKCCCSSLLGERSLLRLYDYATSDWSPWGTIINTLLRQPNNAGSISSVLLLPGKGMVLAQPGYNPPCPINSVLRNGHFMSSPLGNLRSGHQQNVLSLPSKHQITEHLRGVSLQIFFIQAAAKGVLLPCAAVRFGGI